MAERDVHFPGTVKAEMGDSGESRRVPVHVGPGSSCCGSFLIHPILPHGLGCCPLF